MSDENKIDNINDRRNIHKLFLEKGAIEKTAI
jgi:hypothetical protein